MSYKPYWNYQIEKGEFIDPEKRLIYLEDAEPTETGSRKARVQDIETGEIFDCLFVSARTGKAKAPSRKEESYRKSAKKKAKYKEGDIIGKYNDILILDLDSTKYPPKQRKDGKTDRRGLFRNLVTGDEFEATLNAAIYKSSGKIQSLGEKHIAELLDEHHVDYEDQKGFKGLTGFTGGKSMAFDFYLFKENILIEYDGIQHLLSHQDENLFHNTMESRYQAYARDIMKEAWCYANKVPLLRISNLKLDELTYEVLNNKIREAKNNATQGELLRFSQKRTESNTNRLPSLCQISTGVINMNSIEQCVIRFHNTGDLMINHTMKTKT